MPWYVAGTIWCIKVKYWAIICTICKSVFFDVAQVVISTHTYQAGINLAMLFPVLNYIAIIIDTIQ